MLKDKTIIVGGVTGGIAAYKVADVVSRLKTKGCCGSDNDGKCH